MPRVVPSQVCSFIEDLPGYIGPTQLASMNKVGPAALSCVLDLVAQIPDELLTMDNTSYARFILAKATIRDVLETWIANRNAGHQAQAFQIRVSQDPLTVISDALAKCPDESPAPSTSALNFISDVDLRTNLRNDIGAIYRALSNGEWKATTVLAGSAIEALLLWNLQNRSAAAVPAAVANLSTNRSSRPARLETLRIGSSTITSKCPQR